MKHWWIVFLDWVELWLHRFWRMLPDKCEADYCPRHGVRGNEQWVTGLILCDYCYARYRVDEQIMARGRFYDYRMEQRIEQRAKDQAEGPTAAA